MASDIDLKTLDNYLSSEDSPDNCMMLSDMDGFLHGIICSPVTIPSDTWMPVALGADPKQIPNWVLHGITDRFMEIAQCLTHIPPTVEPIFWQAKEGHVIAMDWCEGFMKAVGMEPQRWLRLTESDTADSLMTPILLHLIDNKGNSLMDVPQDKLDKTLDKAAEVIPETVANIFGFWQ